MRESVVPPGGLLVLGPCRIADDDRELTATQRRLLCCLALVHPAAASIDELSDALWGERVPATARASVRNQVSRIRSRLGREAIATVGDRYALHLSVDAAEVVRLQREATEALAEGRFDVARGLAARAQGAWRGLPFTDLDDHRDVAGVRRHLEEVRYGLETVALEAWIELGPSAAVVPEAERLVAAAPDDEHRWVLLIRALDRAGRRGDALGAFDRARRSLVERLGIGPGPALRAAQDALLVPGSPRSSVEGSMWVGREELLAEIESALRDAARVLVAGEPGIGRTHALGALARRARRRGVAAASCRCVAHPSTAVVVLEELAAELGDDLEPGVPPVAAFAEVVTRRVQAGRRVLLIIDDVHLTGPTTVAALRLASTIEGVRLVCSVPDGELVPPGLGELRRVVLPPLDPHAIWRSACSQLPALAERPELEASLHRMCGGNPTMLECLVGDGGWLTGTGAASAADGDLPPPLAMRDLVRERLGRLSIATRAAVEAAAVCGDAIDLRLLSSLVPAAEVDRVVDAGLLEADDTVGGALRFRHDAVRRSVVGDLPPGRRIELHDRIAELLLEAGAPPSAVARHAFAARAVDPERAVARTVEAAEDAVGACAYDDAALWFERAEEASNLLATGEGPRVRARIGRGDALRRAGDPRQEDALVAATEAALAWGDPHLIGEAAYAALQLGVTTESGSLHAWALGLIDRALEVVEDPAQRATVAAAASLALSMTGQPDRCRQLFDDAERAAVDPEVRRRVLPFALLPLGHPSAIDRLDALADELLDLARRVGDPVAEYEGRQQEFAVALQRADGVALRSAMAAMEQLGPRIGDVARRWSLAYHRAAVAHLDGDLELAEACSEEGYACFSSVSPSRALAAHGGQLLAIRLAQGREAELVPALESLVQQQPEVPAWHAAFALAVAADDPDRARAASGRALRDVAADFTWLVSHLLGGRAAARVGDRDLVGRYRRALEPWSGMVAWQGTCSFGPVDAVLAELATAAGDLAAESQHEERARRACASLAAPVHLADLGR